MINDKVLAVLKILKELSILRKIEDINNKHLTNILQTSTSQLRELKLVHKSKVCRGK